METSDRMHSDSIEKCLAHAPKDEIRAKYNRHQYHAEQRDVLQRWADQIDRWYQGNGAAENCHLIVPVASMSANTSDARQTVVRGPSLMGNGNLPSRTPCHHVDLLIGMSGGMPRFLSPRIWESRKNPSLGMDGRCMFDHL